MRNIAIVCAGFFLLPGFGLSPAIAKDDLPPGPLKLTIRSAEPEYVLKEAKAGNVIIHAQVQNTGEETVLLAHPNMSFPHELSEGQSLVRDLSESHLSVQIENPRGNTTVLTNNGLRNFDPGNRHHMTIPPGQSSTFFLGWFGPEYNVGQWILDQPVFTETGEYRITVRFKNAYPVAYVFDESGKQSPADAWTGVIQSNTISLPVTLR